MKKSIIMTMICMAAFNACASEEEDYAAEMAQYQSEHANKPVAVNKLSSSPSAVPGALNVLSGLVSLTAAVTMAVLPVGSVISTAAIGGAIAANKAAEIANKE